MPFFGGDVMSCSKRKIFSVFFLGDGKKNVQRWQKKNKPKDLQNPVKTGIRSCPPFSPEIFA